MRRRFWVIGGMACVAAVVLAGASLAARTSKSAPAAEKVNLTMWWWGEQEAAGAKTWLAQTVKLFEQKYPNVTIKTVLQTTDGLVPAFKAAAAAKKGPDLQYFWGGIWSLEDAWAGHTKAISDYIPASEGEALHQRPKGGDTYNGKVWTAPAGTCSRRSRSSTARTCSRRQAWRRRRRGRAAFRL